MSSTVRVQVSKRQLAVWVQKFPEAVDRAIDRSIPMIEEMAAMLTPVKTGELRKSIQVVRTQKGLVIRWTAPHAKVAESGSPPHIILPKTKKALSFEGPEGLIVVKKVRHPGYPGWGYKEDVRKQAVFIIKANILDEIGRL